MIEVQNVTTMVSCTLLGTAVSNKKLIVKLPFTVNITANAGSSNIILFSFSYKSWN
jgi:hypothetical protein